MSQAEQSSGRMRARGTLFGAVPDPKQVVGIAVMMFGGWLAFEGTLMKCAAQLAIAATFVAAGWWLRRRGIGAAGGVSGFDWRAYVRRCARFLAVAVPVFAAFYVVGYFALMDRHCPSAPYLAFVKYESTFRWAPRDWVEKARPPYKTPWGEVTTWNLIYQPMDRLWFRYFPRSAEEQERLHALGYYR